MIITGSLYFFVRRRYSEFYINYLGGKLKGNFSFAILVVEIIQCGLMVWNGKKKK